ncbi:MAG: DnaJ domain-containing protein [Coriobacteriales bacterium]|jgi:DnaJ-class molecular chaperone|nr:DnaJ domain-containing protein [Coriobacteriales bacterium]
MASMNEKDYYAILGVSESATTDEIRKAFQQKARKLHPDVNKEPGAEEKFKEVSEAYAVLSDDDKRRRYDAMRSGSPFVGYGGSSSGNPYGGYSTGQGDPFAGTPFGWGFPFGTTTSRTSTRSRAYRPKAGADIMYDVVIDEDVAEKGGRRGMTFQRYATCEHCHGTGSVEHAHSETCPTCKGVGHITVDLSGLFGFGVMEMQCPECEGSGRVVADPCEVCGGSGRVLTASEVIVNIPANSHDGDEVRIAGMGNAGTNGKESGDFVCRFEVPAEHLSGLQARAFHTYGFAAPFMLLGVLYGSIMSTVGWWAVLFLIGTFMLAQGGPLTGHNRRWWRNAMMSFLAGFQSGMIVAAFMFAFTACNALMWGR